VVSDQQHRVEVLAGRLLAMFPDWGVHKAVVCARRVVETTDQMAFQVEAEQGLAEIPVISEREAA
jgi:hypothetical protein